MKRSLLILALLSRLSWGQGSEMIDAKLFADFTAGDGWSAQVAVQNNSTRLDLEGWLLARDGEGETRDIFGKTQTMGFFGGRGIRLSIPPGGTKVFKSKARKSLLRGSVVVLQTSDQWYSDLNQLAVVLTYRHAQSGIEVSVPPLDFNGTGQLGDFEMAYSVFVEESDAVGTGLAVWRTAGAKVCFVLFDEDGNRVEGENGWSGVCYSGEDQHLTGTLPEFFDHWDFSEGFMGRLAVFVENETHGSYNDGSLFGQGIRFSKDTQKPSLSAIPWLPISDTGLNSLY